MTDQNVDAAIQRAVAWIKSQRNEEGHWQRLDNPKDRDWAGNSGLAVLSLLYADEDPREEFLARSLEWLMLQKLNGTYAYGTRAHALAIVPGGAYKSLLEADLQWLLKAVWPRESEHPGCYNYTPPREGRKKGRWDNSVSQYGVLGVWMAAEAGLKVPDWYWEIVGEHWLSCQNHDGGWGYKENEKSTGSMTAAGLASLFVVLDQRYAARPKEAPGLLSALEAALNWLGREYTPENPGGQSTWKFYYLYGVERAGRASGYKYFRDKDWFREGATFLLDTQKPDGQWRSTGGQMNELRNTTFALMFLCHGRAPLLFNKLQHQADWNNRLRDVAGLTRYVGHTFERLLNWQIVRLEGPIEDLMDAPVLYMYGESTWEFNEVEVQKVREYCQRGGLLFAVAGKDSDKFRRAFEKLAKQAFPEFALRPLPDEHPLFTGEVSFPIDNPPVMLEVNNGVRTLMLFSTRDLAEAWNKYAVRGKGELDFQIGSNVYLYATDKTTIRSRLQTPYIALRETEIERTINLARVKYDGKWDVEPYGWTRLARYMHNETATRLLVTSGVTFDSAAIKDFRAAYITGTESFEFTTDEMKGLRRFLNGGGTLLADAAGGSREFIKALDEQLREILRDEPRVLPPDSFLLTGVGVEDAVDLAGTSYRRAAHSEGAGRKYPRLKTFGSRRRFSVIYTPLDLSASLLGTQVFSLAGYEPESTLRILRNLLLYAELSSAEKAALHRGE
ncbi:MAG: DUF4159 domain-containing protein [Phycisphaerae bacterium]|nr:DUF4159 domain-containing protein [Phycisphaerae bacterium]